MLQEIWHVVIYTFDIISWFLQTTHWTYCGEPWYLGPDGDQILLQQPLLIGDLLGVGQLLLVLLHLLVGQIQHTLQLVLGGGDESSSRGSIKARTLLWNCSADKHHQRAACFYSHHQISLNLLKYWAVCDCCLFQTSLYILCSILDPSSCGCWI